MAQTEAKHKNDTEDGQEEKMISQLQLITFEAGSEIYAFNIDEVNEVVLSPDIAHVPLMPKYVKGVANVRGSILPMVSLEDKLGHTIDADTQKHRYTIVVKKDNLSIGVLSFKVPNTIRVLESALEEPSTVLQEVGGSQNYVKALIRNEQNLIILIDIFALIPKTEIAEFLKIKKTN